MAADDELTYLGKELSCGDSARRIRALERLLARYPRVPTTLTTSLAACAGDPHSAVQRRAADALTRVGDRAAVRAALEPALAAADANARWGAAYALAAAMGPDRTLLPILLEALGHPDGDRRWAAAELTVAVARRSPITEELLRLTLSGSAGQRKMSWYCLRDLEVSGRRVAEAVIGGLADEDPTVRLAALAASARCAPSARVVGAVARLLEQDPVPGVRRAAVAALGLCRDVPAARQILERAIENADPAIRRAASQALRRRTGRA